jgi:hypothetical protein
MRAAAAFPSARQTAADDDAAASANGNGASGVLSGIPADPKAWSARPFLAWAWMLAQYHRYEVRYMERLGRLLKSGRRVIVVSNHALDIIDPLLFVSTVLNRYGCVPRFIGHENFVFTIPLLREVAKDWQVLPSRQMEETAEALERDRFLMLFPGSGTEALMRDYRREPYKLKWENRTGFVRLALEHDADIVFAAAVGNDDLYYQSRVPLPPSYLALLNAGDAERYRGARMQFGLFGPHLLPAMFPLPVRLTHVVSRPLDLGDRQRALSDPAAFDALHHLVCVECQSLLDAAVQRERRKADVIDRGVRSVQGLLRRCGV